MSTVLVTGGSGFIGSHCLLQLLEAGYDVRATVRNLNREGHVRAQLGQAGAQPGDRLRFFAADLEMDAGWREAVAGCEYVLHVASPFPPNVPRHEDELIVPAREGALRVLRASRDAGVKRVVLTSSFAAIGYGQKPQETPFNETNWTDPNGEGMHRLREVENPGRTRGVGFHRPRRRRTGAFRRQPGSRVRPGAGSGLFDLDPARAAPDGRRDARLPTALFRRVDVRDVADLHMRAMTHPAARGERFLAVAGDFMWMVDIARVLKRRMGEAAKRVPTRQLPDWLVRVASLRDPAVKQILPELGKRKNATNEKARRMLGWAPRSNEEAIVATAESLARLGILKDSASRAA